MGRGGGCWANLQQHYGEFRNQLHIRCKSTPDLRIAQPSVGKPKATLGNSKETKRKTEFKVILGILISSQMSGIQKTGRTPAPRRRSGRRKRPWKEREYVRIRPWNIIVGRVLRGRNSGASRWVFLFEGGVPPPQVPSVGSGAK